MMIILGAVPKSINQQRATTNCTWRCIMAVNTDEKQHQNLETGSTFLTYGCDIIEKTVVNDNERR